MLHFLDARHRVSRVDKQLAEYIVEENKPAIFVVNKWDLVKDDMTTDKMGEYIREKFPMLDHVPIAFITAKNGKNVLRLLQLAVQLHKQAGVRVGTGDLNRTIRAAVEAAHPAMSGSKTPKIFYATQIGVHPPTIVLFTNGPELFDATYIRYLTKVLRDTFPFSEVAIKVVLRAKGEGIRRGFEGQDASEEVSDTDEETPIVRAPKRAPEPHPEPADEPASAPRLRKKPRGSETWDF